MTVDTPMGPMTAVDLATLRWQLRTDAERYPEQLQPIPRKDWPLRLATTADTLIRALRSRTLLVQVFDPGGTPWLRMSVCRALLGADGRWEDGLTWDDLQQAKHQAGYGHLWATEVYPPDDQVVDVANMRHLWLYPPDVPPPAYAWRA